MKVGDFLEEYYKIINELTNNEELPKKESEVWKLIILVYYTLLELCKHPAVVVYCL